MDKLVLQGGLYQLNYWLIGENIIFNSMIIFAVFHLIHSLEELLSLHPVKVSFLLFQ